MATLATLTVDLVGRSAKLHAELKKANRGSKSWAQTTRKHISTVTKTFTAMGVIATAALVKIYSSNAQMLDKLAKTSDALGIMPGKLTALHHAANLTGVSNEVVNKSLQRMIRNVSDAAAGTGEATETIEQLGLSAERLNQLAPEAQFKLISDAMQGVEKHSDRVRLSIELFGRSGAELLNTMNLGSKGLEDMEREVEALGMAVNRVDLAKVEMANDAFDRAKKSTVSFGQVLATQTAPLVGTLADMWTESAKEAGGFGVVAQNVVTSVASGIGFLGDMGRGLEVSFLLVRQAVAELSNFIVQDLAKAADFGYQVLKKLGIESDALKNFSYIAEDWQNTTDIMADELSNLLDKPMPSEKIDEWIAQVRQDFEVKAESAAKKSRERINLSNFIETDSTEAVGKTKDFWESYLTSVRETAQNTDQLWADTLTSFSRNVSNSVTNAIFEWEGFGKFTETIASNFSRAVVGALVEIGAQRLTLWALEKTIGTSTSASYATTVAGQAQAGAHLAAINAFASTAAIPIVGPAAAPAAAATAEAFTQPLAAAASAAALGTMASFEGGGYVKDGIRSGGIDNRGGKLAVLHPNETVIDHNKDKGQSQPVKIENHFHGIGDNIENVAKFARRNANKIKSMTRPVS